MGRGFPWTFFLEMSFLSTLKAFSFCFRFEVFYGIGVSFLIEAIVYQLLSSIFSGNYLLPVEILKGWVSSKFGYPFLRRKWGCITKLVV